MIDTKPLNNGKTNVSLTLPAAIGTQGVSVTEVHFYWNPDTLPMQSYKDGTWRTSVEPNAEQSYQFQSLSNDALLTGEHCRCCLSLISTENSLLRN